MSDGEHMASDHRTRAVEWLTHDLAVTAGAGAGKTTVLVDRFVRIARDPAVGPDRILAITYTRKAAAEMKERAIRIFEQAGEHTLRQQTEAAAISTIHGFAERILRERPFDARIDPAFTVLTEYEQARFFEEAVQSMYAREDLRAIALRLKKEFQGGWRVFSLVTEVAALLREGPDAARTEAELVHDEARCVSAALDRAKTVVHDAADRMLAALRELLPMLDGASFKSHGAKFKTWRAYVAAAAACVEQQSVLAADASIWRGTTFTSEIPADERAPIRALLDRIKALAPVGTYHDWQAQEALERELLPVKRAIYGAAEEITRAYTEHKRRAGALDFHDLQRRAADLLASNAAVRAEYAHRFRHILLDEAQDTDELQYQIIQSLRNERNTLFIVGDPKQAIYEFRGANPEVFRTVLDQLREEHQLVLRENFRSRPEIISFVNGVGPALLGSAFVHIDARADYDGQWLEAPAITALYAIQQPLPSDGGRARYEPITDARPREAAAVVEEIVRLLREQPRVRDPEQRTTHWVPLRPKHIALLFRTRTAIPYFEHALAERGVPYVTAAGQGFYERAEVLDCMMMLRVVAQPLDDLALAAVLRSPFVGVSDVDLWRLRAPAAMANGNDRERHASRSLYEELRHDALLAHVHASIDALRRRTRGRPAWYVLDDALRTFGYETAIAACQDGPAMLANVAKLRRELRDLGALSPMEAYAELERTRELMPAEALAPLVGSADDVVVLTTIHQAKGLEWPIVCLPNLQGKSPDSRPGFSARHGALLCDAIGPDGEPVTPLSMYDMLDEIRARAEAEERRLLYVALTRARERLILSASVKESALAAKDAATAGDVYSSPLTFLLGHTERTLADEGEHDCGSYRTRVRCIHQPVVERTLYQAGEPLAAEFRPAAIEAPPPEPPLAPVLPLSVKATELLAYRRCPQVYRFKHDLEIQENLARRAAVRGAEHAGPSPVELGTIVHALLERARFDAADVHAEIARLLETQPAELHAALGRMLESVLDGELGAAVRAARRVEREWRFAIDLDGVLVEGVIDLALQDAGGRWTVVDYKSNDFSRTGRLEYLIDYYTRQLELYALALSRAGVGTVTDCALVFLAGPVVHRWGFDESARDIDAWLHETIARIAAREYQTSAGPKCELCGYRKRKLCTVGQGWTATPLGDATRDVATPHDRTAS